MSIEVPGRTQLAGALDNPRFEIVPVSGLWDQLPALPEGARVTVTTSKQLGLERTISTAKELSGMGFRVVPHLTARQIIDRSELAQIVERLTDAGIEDIMVLAGDSDSPAGQYTSSLEVLRDLADLGNPFEQIGIAGYPEGHPAISTEGLRQALRSKAPYATYIVTQLCFSADAIGKWVSTIRSDGIDLPVYVGVPGRVSRKRLLRMASKIGVGDSLRFLKRQSGNMFRLMFSNSIDPGDLLLELEPLLSGEHGVAGFHLYTFNEIAATEEWRIEMLRQLRR